MPSRPPSSARLPAVEHGVKFSRGSRLSCPSGTIEGAQTGRTAARLADNAPRDVRRRSPPIGGLPVGTTTLPPSPPVSLASDGAAVVVACCHNLFSSFSVQPADGRGTVTHSSPDMDIEVAVPTAVLIPEAAHLLWLFAYPEDTDASRLDRCVPAVQRFLADPSAHLWLACVAGLCVGLITMAWSRSTSTGLPVLRVEGLYVLPEYRRRGVATALLDAAADLARSRGANRLQLETDRDNLPARQLYERQGLECFPRKTVYMRFL